MGRTGWLLSLGMTGFLVHCAGNAPPPGTPDAAPARLAEHQREPGSVPPEGEPARGPTSADGDPLVAPDSPRPVPVSKPLPSGTKVLQVGDSFAGALGLPLGKLLKAEGVSSTLKHTDASYLTDWAWDGSLQKYIWRYNPDLIIVTLGANELEITDPEARAKTIRKLVSVIGDRPCVWVGIPLWAGPKNGLLDVIAKNAAPCIYLDTNHLMDVAAMPRIRDGIHPTEAAREDWAKVVLDWLRRHQKDEAGRPWSLRPD